MKCIVAICGIVVVGMMIAGLIILWDEYQKGRKL